MPRMQALEDNRDIPAETRAPMIRALENHQRDLSARKYVADCLDAAERHMGNHAVPSKRGGEPRYSNRQGTGSSGLEAGSGAPGGGG